MARVASQSTIHPLDTMKVRMQAGGGASGASSSSSGGSKTPSLPPRGAPRAQRLESKLLEVRGLYKVRLPLLRLASYHAGTAVVQAAAWPEWLFSVTHRSLPAALTPPRCFNSPPSPAPPCYPPLLPLQGVVGAATGAGIIIGTYFAFYSTTKRFLRERTDMGEGQMAFTAGAAAALGSSVVKVPLAVCIRSVQAGIYKNVFHAAQSIVKAAGVRGLFTVSMRPG